MTIPVTRSSRFDDLVLEHGAAAWCEVATDVLVRGVEPLQYALMEDDHRGEAGGPWWSFGDSAEELLTRSANQEHPDDWPATLVVDLDTGQTWHVERRYALVDPQHPAGREVTDSGGSDAD